MTWNVFFLKDLHRFIFSTLSPTTTTIMTMMMKRLLTPQLALLTTCSLTQLTFSFTSCTLPTKKGLASVPPSSFLSSLRTQQQQSTLLHMSSSTVASSSATRSLPSWSSLQEKSRSTSVGKALIKEIQLRESGLGSAARENTLRKFDSIDEPQITLFRDHAGWCPYCQKTMLLVEEKRIPIKIELMPMRSYGDKPMGFLRKVPNGLLPAIEINGKIITESQVIMELLDQLYPESKGYRPMLPDKDKNPEAFARYQRLAKLERELFRWWCTLVFYPEDNDDMGGGNPFSRLLGGGGSSGSGGSNNEMSSSMKGFMDCIQQVDKYLTSTKGPWFFEEYDYPTMIDFVFVSHVERILASCAYWKGLNLRDPKWNLKGLNAWIDAFEKREPYLAFKSDYYTHVMDIPPQYGPGYDGGFEQDRIKMSNSISGKDGTSWHLPLSHDDPLQPLYRGPPLPLAVLEAVGIQADKNGSYESCNAKTMARACRLYAAFKLAHNGVNVARFAARGGPNGGKNMRKTFQAPLADPYAEPDASLQPTVDAVLRVICNALLGVDSDSKDDLPSDASKEQLLAAIPEKKQIPGVVSSLAYLRDRVGVPRDMPLAAARYLRGYLNWGIDTLQK